MEDQTIWTFSNVVSVLALIIAGISVTFTGLTYVHRVRQSQRSSEPEIDIRPEKWKFGNDLWHCRMTLANRGAVPMKVTELRIKAPKSFRLLAEEWTQRPGGGFDVAPPRVPRPSKRLALDATLAPIGSPRTKQTNDPSRYRHDFFLVADERKRRDSTTVAADISVVLLGSKAKGRVFRATFQIVQDLPQLPS